MPKSQHPSSAPISSSDAGAPEPIAIIGIGCRFPGGAHDPASFWRLLSRGEDAIREVPADRFSIARFCDPNPQKPGKTVSRWGGFVQQRVEQFDAPFFGMSPREAAYLDPMQRWLLEVSWEALEDAGQVPEALAGSATAIFIGGFTEDIKLLQMDPQNRELLGPHAATGSAMTMLANRLSYFFDFHGPSVALDTACSSSLVAVHLACRSLWAGESTLALAGGANAMFRPEYTIAESKAGMLSPDGRSKAFDARANGYVRGEGAGVVVLKPLSRARADGDPIYAVIRATGVNQDGRTNGITVPNGNAQQLLFREVCERAGISPGRLQYVEAHGTGTPVGDPIELNALAAVLAEGRATDEPCWVGSVKTNIGHLEAAAGVAGLVKAALALKHAAIPPHLHFQTPNPAIALDELCVRIPRRLEPWPVRQGPRLASVNSFGFGGTNAHVLLEAAPKLEPLPRPEPSPEPKLELLVLSGRSERALLDNARAHAHLLAREAEESPSFLADLSHSAATRRSHHEHRLAAWGASRVELATRLEAFANGSVSAGVVSGRRSRAPERLVFVFGGMGPQWWGMGQQLFAREPVFRRAVEECDELLRQLSPWSLLEEMLASEPRSRMSETQIAQPASFALQVGLSALWKSWGVVPDAIVGHSAGEVAAALAAGVYDLEQAVRIIYHRSRLQHRTTGQGKLVALGISLSEARAALASCAAPISIAAVNGPSALTLVGELEALEAFVAPYQERQVFVRFLKVEVPYHSHYMEPLRAELLETLSSIRPRPARLPLFSTVTGALSAGTEWDAEYWWRNVREPVLFAPAVQELLGAGYDAFLELGAHPVLGAAIQESSTLLGKPSRVLASLRRQSDERACLLEALGSLHVHGRAIDWRGLHQSPRRYVPLPLYPWQREAHWSESSASARDRVGTVAHPLLGPRLVAAVPSWENAIDLEQLPYIQDHVVGGTIVYPGAGYIEMMLAAARELAGDAGALLELARVEFEKALFLAPEAPTTLQVARDDEHGTVSVSSRSAHGEQWLRHSKASFRRLPSSRGSRRAALPDWRAEHGHALSTQACYDYLRSLGLQYGPGFQGIRELWRGERSSLAKVELPAQARSSPSHYVLHPALLDACFQVMLVTTAPEPGTESDGPARTYLPTQIQALRLLREVPEVLWVRTKLLELDERIVRGSLEACDEHGDVVLELESVVARSLEHQSSAPNIDVASLLYSLHWEPEREALPGDDSAPTARSWLLLADQRGFARRLAQELEARGDRATLVLAGERFEHDRATGSFVVNPARREDFQRALQTADAQQPIYGVIHGFSLDGAPGGDLDLPAIEAAETRGPLALLQLFQALERCELSAPPRVWALTRGTQAVTSEQPPTSVAEATLWGLMRVVAYQEHPDRYGGLVDLDPDAPANELASLAADLSSGRVLDQLCYRNGQRFVPRLVPRRELAELTAPPTFRPDGSYLVTGGLGGLGLVVARWMVERGARRLILVGRSALPARSEWAAAAVPAESALGQRIAALRDLEAQGASVHLAALDVADEAALVSFLDQYRREGWPAIRGVIHAAGVSTPRLLQELTAEQYLETTRPKVRGGWLLHQHLSRDPLDFFVLFSSVAALAFTAGQADYAAANSFLDTLAHYRRARGLPATSINWGPWAEAGMATLLGNYFVTRGMTPFAPDRGLLALGQLLQHDVDQATVLWISDRQAFKERNFSARSDVSLIAQVVDTATERPEQAAPTEDALAAISSTADRAEQLERILGYLEIAVARALRLSSTGLDRQCSLGDLGLDSLLAVELKSRIAGDLRVNVAVVELLKGVSVQQLGQRLQQLLAERSPDEPAAPPVANANAPVTGQVPLGPNQRWFLARNLANPHHWNMAALWEVIEPLEPERLGRAVAVVLEQHDALRMRFAQDESGWQQWLAPPDGSVPFTRVDLSHVPREQQEAALEDAIAKLQTELNLFTGPLLKVAYFALGGSERDRLLVVIHHLVSDVLSQQIVVADLQLAYRELGRTPAPAWPAKTTSFKAWVERLTEQVRARDTRPDLEYWRNQPWHRAAPLPLDYPAQREQNTIASASILTHSLSEAETRALLQALPRTHHVQIMDALLTAFAQAFKHVTGRDHLLLDVIMHGREALSDDMDLARTVGLFAHGIPLLLGLPESGDAVADLLHVKAQFDRFLARSRSFAALRWLSQEPALTELLAGLPRRELVFNYIGQFDTTRSDEALVRVVPKVPRSLEDRENPRDFVVQCQVGVLNGCLTALWSYSANLHAPTSIERLSRHFMDALCALSELPPHSKTLELPGAPAARDRAAS